MELRDEQPATDILRLVPTIPQAGAPEQVQKLGSELEKKLLPLLDTEL
jgi:hypothetical protein